VDSSQQWRVRSTAHVAIHSSQFPENIRRDLLTSLRTRQLNHKFLYQGIKQHQKWLALHQACSPAQTDADCVETYDKAFAAAADQIAAQRIHVLSLGCGGGQKDARLLRRLRQSGKRVGYTPCDVSLEMVLTARHTVMEVLESEDCFPFVCDLLAPDDWGAALLQPLPDDAGRLVAFFGMIPNFEPAVILPRLAALLRPGDCLLLSANLAPGTDYEAGVKRVIPLYDNTPTREWLMGFLLELGVEPPDGELCFAVEDCPCGSGLKRIVANFCFQRPKTVPLDGHRFDFTAGENLRLFFSYRHTPEQVRMALGKNGIAGQDQWISRSGEEGVFLGGLSKLSR
jgi:uncharacterized SAM-dependent methyltransferase